MLGGALAHDLERLDKARLAVAAPVAARCTQQLRIEVAALSNLRGVGANDRELAVHELVDGDEAGRVEIDGARRALVAEDPRNLEGGRHDFGTDAVAVRNGDGDFRGHREISRL